MRKHPRGLITLAGTELNERASFYGMRAILVLFLAATVAEGGMGLGTGTATAIVGLYMALSYFTTLPGGWIADRVLGERRTVLVGGVIIMLGHVSLAVQVGDVFVWAGLILVCLGTGFLKPNVTSLVGKLYTDDTDARRDAGYSLYYMGINIGSLIGTLVIGYIGEKVSWHIGFSVAAVGMALGLTQYVLGQRSLGEAGKEPGQPLTAPERTRMIRWVAIGAAVVCAAIALSVATGTFSIDRVTYVLTALAIVVPILYFVNMLVVKRDRIVGEERTKLKAFLWLFIASAVFWMIFDQAAGPLTLFAKNDVDLHLLGFEVPAGWTQAANPLMVILFSGVFALVWTKLGNRVSTAAKFSVALVVAGLSFVLMAAATAATDGGTVKVSLLWLVGVYLLLTIAELCLSPVGLSMTSKLAPKAYAGQMMGLFFLSIAAGDAVGAQVSRLQPAMGGTYYLVLGLLAIVCGIALSLFVGKLRALMGEHRDTDTAADAAAEQRA
ncbi:POT family proton-dependent oligopeptide transporter [Nocardiopsis mwathae]|uniref:POT family proton-dependent oligopeptide transporter n=1 Tax=Nocardiopsis mwathae TaxID=1472723 RepID=A0A7X0D4K2_9ACTN|nr:oligopeptide:H+ symporter [Nocardiopsis mwathae]MBB6171392.1 POT family proton-dependent oligopeptide transporter [Nocardiopsis mwathae]